MKSNHETLLYILGGSLVGFFVLQHLTGKEAFAAKKQKMDKMQMKMMMMAAPMCTCADGTTVASIAVPGMANQFSCPCPATAVAPGRAIPAVRARADPLQTIPNIMAPNPAGLMPGTPGTVQGLAVGGTATGMAFAAEDDEGFAADDDIQMALMNAGVMNTGDITAQIMMAEKGVGKDELKKLTDAVKKQGVMGQQMRGMRGQMAMGQMRMRAGRETCTCPDGTKVAVANGICNCGATATAGAIGLNRAIRQRQPATALDQVPATRQQARMPRQMRAAPTGGVSPTNTGQVCVLDPISNTFKLSGTNVKCDPGGGLTMAASPAVKMGESVQPLPDKFSMVLPSTLYAKAYAAPTSTYGELELPLIPVDDEDLYEDYGNLQSAYPNSHIQDLVSQYDEDSHTLPFFTTEPNSYKQITLPVSNYPRR